LSSYLGNLIDHAVDGENNRIVFDYAYPVRKSLTGAVEQLRSMHGDGCFFLPMSGQSCGGGVFQSRPDTAAVVVALQFEACANPRVHSQSSFDLAAIELDEIVIDSEQQLIYCGASITLEQLNQELANKIGYHCKVAGADLTSYRYAATGATFMTGGMGPQRRYFSDSVIQAAIFDGKKVVIVEEDALENYAGTYGWSGIVTALCCRYFRFPQNEFSFAIPVSNEPQNLARLLAHLAAFTYLELDSGLALSSSHCSDLILGLEHVSRESFQPLLQKSGDEAMHKRALDLQDKMDIANAQGLIFVHAMCERNIDEFLLLLLDDADSDELTMAGIPLEQVEIFRDAEEMRLIREAIPYAARMQATDARFIYKNHTDANIRLAPDEVEAEMQKLWQINREYVEAAEVCIQQHDQVEGQVLVYGHLNPYGVDPHNRVTISSSDEDAFEQCREQLKVLREHYYRQLAALCEQTGARFIGGEKSADSEIAIFHALGGPQNCPSELLRKFERQRETIRAAATIFNWRAIAPY